MKRGVPRDEEDTQTPIGGPGDSGGYFLGRPRVHCEGPTDDTVWWDIEWDDAQGQHHIMHNVPMFDP